MSQVYENVCYESALEMARVACSKFQRHFSLFSEASGFGRRLSKYLSSTRVKRLIGSDESEMLVESLEGFASKNRLLYAATNKAISQWISRSDFRRKKMPKDRRSYGKAYYPYSRGRDFRGGDRGGHSRRGGRGGSASGGSGMHRSFKL